MNKTLLIITILLSLAAVTVRAQEKFSLVYIGSTSGADFGFKGLLHAYVDTANIRPKGGNLTFLGVLYGDRDNFKISHIEADCNRFAYAYLTDAGKEQGKDFLTEHKTPRFRAAPRGTLAFAALTQVCGEQI